MATAVPPATGNGRKAPQGLPSGRFVARDLDRSVPRGHRPASRRDAPRARLIPNLEHHGDHRELAQPLGGMRLAR